MDTKCWVLSISPLIAVNKKQECEFLWQEFVLLLWVSFCACAAFACASITNPSGLSHRGKATSSFSVEFHFWDKVVHFQRYCPRHWIWKKLQTFVMASGNGDCRRCLDFLFKWLEVVIKVHHTFVPDVDLVGESKDLHNNIQLTLRVKLPVLRTWASGIIPTKRPRIWQSTFQKTLKMR